MIIDPTRTKMLRMQYSRQLTKQFRRFQRNALISLIEIINRFQEGFNINRTTRAKTLRQTGFNTEIERYLNWAIEHDILEPSYTIAYNNVKQAYFKGIKDSSRKLKRYPDYIIGENMTMLDWEALVMIRDLNTDLIKGCTEAMKTAIQRSCSQGILNGWGMNKIAYSIKNNINGNSNMGIIRAKTIARTEIINAYNTAAEKRYKEAGLSETEILWSTSFDERTCDICAGYDGMTLAQTGERPPAHPNCRCALVPNPK